MPSHRPLPFVIVPLSAALFLMAGGGFCRADDPSAEQIRFFESKIRPVLAENCYKCHGPDKQKAGLRLDAKAHILKGSSSGPVVIAGQPDKSVLMRAVRHADAAAPAGEDKVPAMPPDRKLSDRQIADLAQWIKNGLPYPSDRDAAGKDTGKTFWAFKPPVNPPVPIVKQTPWPRSDLDRFVLAHLEAKQLKPAPPADRRVVIRRVSFDLTGLPPTPAEMDAFLSDASPDAYARLVERLLASPRYGERWGRHWLDVARYADSNGLDENVAFGNAWRYRDYIVASFNQDKPYDQMLLEQLAGDLLGEPAGLAKEQRDQLRRDRLIATGFLALGPKVLAEVDERKMEMDIIDEQIDTLGRAVLGLTLGCARCHDHKFDPLTLHDYYGLAGIFKSTRTMESFKKIARWHENALSPEKNGPTAMGVAEGPVVDVPIFKRGNHLKPGAVAPRRVPEVLVSTAAPVFEARKSGRLELAQWLVSADHPLTARVMVNRIWRWHFGRGIAANPDNFGMQSEPPENQALLDWLACRFVESKWSIKAMHRLILLSSTYQMASTAGKETLAADPENRRFARAPVRRLSAEEIRDSILSVSGRLDLTMGGSLLHVKNREFLFDHTSKDMTKYDSRRRSLYLPVIRNNVYDVFQLFDFPDPAVPNGDRATTTVAPQALFFLNSDWVAGMCDNLADDLLKEAKLDDAGRVNLLYRKAFARPATQREQERGLALVRAVERAMPAQNASEAARRVHAWSCLCQSVLASNEFIYVE